MKYSSAIMGGIIGLICGFWSVHLIQFIITGAIVGFLFAWWGERE